MRCPCCNARLTKKNKFCPECGETVVWEEKEPSQERNPRSIRTFVVVGILLLLVAVAIWTTFGTTQNIEEVKDSVVMIEVYDTDNKLLATGSGFCAYNENWIVTNFHVIEGAKSITIITDDRQKYAGVDVVFFNKEQDLAVIAFTGNLKPLKLGDGFDINIQDKITTIGSPKGELNTVSEGIISNADDKYEIRITAPISHGSSGGVLLNRKNEVIGITSAGYDDAQNLNFAINIALLESLYTKYKNQDTEFIADPPFSSHFGSLDNFNDYLMSDSACYLVSSLDVFYKLTDQKTRFAMLLAKEFSGWLDVYDSLEQDKQEEIVRLFIELNELEFDDNNIAGSIETWNKAEFFINLGVLSKYEYAIVAVDVGIYVDEDALFYNVDEWYPLDAAEKSLILYLLGDFKWSDIHTDNKKDICDYFDSKYGTEDLGAILEILGYRVKYNNDGTLTAYW